MQKPILFILFIFALHSVQAQYNSSFALNHADEVLERFVLDPHYEQNNLLLYCEIPNAIRIKYHYNTNGKIDKKTLLTWDKYNEVWTRFQETYHTYADNRLVEKYTLEWTPTHNIMKAIVPHKIMHENIIFNKEANTETITTIVEKPNTLDADIFFSVVYYGEHSGPDSAKTLYLGDITKSEYFYNNNNQCIRQKSTTIVREGESTFTTNIQYKANKITFTTEQSPSNDEYYSPTMSVTYDNKNRVVEQCIEAPEGIGMQSKIKYDEEGRTVVKREINEIRGIPNFNMNEIKYETQYNSEGYLVSTFYTADRHDAYKKKAVSYALYDTNGPLTHFQKEKYDNGKLNEKEKYENTYNTNGLLTAQRSYDWDNNTKQWRDWVKDVYEYDKHGFLVFYQSYKNQQSNINTWYGNNYLKKSFNAQGQTLYDEYFGWDSEKQRWENRNKKMYTYSPSGKNTSFVEYRWSTYDNSWHGAERDSTIYDARDSMKIKIDYYWNTQAGSWQFKEKIESFYTDTSKRQEYCVWEKGSWQPTKAKTNSDNNKVKTYCYEEWNNSLQKWEAKGKTLNYMLGDSLTVQELYSWHNEKKVLYGFSKEISQNNNGKEVRAYHEWDFQTQSFYPNERYTGYYEQNHYHQMLEKYDTILQTWIPYKRKIEYYDSIRNAYRFMEVWNQQTHNWENQKHEWEEFKTKNSILVWWNKNTQQWDNFMKRERIVENEDYFYLWDETQNNWKKESRVIYKGFSDYYKWNNDKNDWIPSDTWWESEEEIGALIKLFSFSLHQSDL